MDKILIINGPNLNLLGSREEKHYGQITLNEIQSKTNDYFDGTVLIDWWQSNSETEIINKIQELHQLDYKALVINPAAYSHTSIAILDALLTLNIPIAEAHLSNVHQREEFRQTLLTAKAASIIMCGLKEDTYIFAIQGILNKLKEDS